MNKVSLKDIYEVKENCIVSDVDKISLIEFYQPLIGASSIGLYLTLLNDPSKENNVTSSFETLSLLTGLTIGELFSSFEGLEATGLVKTYCKSNKDITYFVFDLFAPLCPQDFIGDILLLGTLRKQIGEKLVNALISKYAETKKIEGFDNVSTTFNTYFSPSFSNASLYEGVKQKEKGHKRATIKTGFDIVSMIRNLSDLKIKESDFSSKEIKFIEKIATLYNLDESQMASLVSVNFDPEMKVGEKVDLNKLENSCRNTFSSAYRLDKPVEGKKSDKSTFSSSMTSQKVKLMEETSPSEYLAILAGGHKPATSDLKIVEDLALDLGLTFPVINALVDYVLLVNNNILSKAYIEKIGAAIAREGLKTALDTMDYLTRVNSAFKNNKNSKKKVTQTNEESALEETTEVDEFSDEEIDKMLASLKKG